MRAATEDMGWILCPPRTAAPSCFLARAAYAGAGSVALMRAIKRALDPLNTLNPGKIFSV